MIFGGIIKSHGRVSVLAKLLMGVQIVIYPIGGCKEKSFLKVINMRWVGLAAQYMITGDQQPAAVQEEMQKLF